MEHNTKNSGFSLLELAIVITIVAITLTAGVMLFNEYKARQRVELTVIRAKEILQAVDDFADEYDHLPCPADPESLMTDTTYGVGSKSGNNCNAVNIIEDSNIRMGMVPTATLNIYPTYAIDGWGNRFSYVIRQLSASTSEWQSDSNDSNIELDLTNFQGTSSYENVAVIVISHGENKFGSWPGRGSASRFNTTGGIDQEDENADGDMTFRTSITAEKFDDILYFLTEQQSKDESME